MNSTKILASLPVAIRTLRNLSAMSLDSDVTFQQLRVLNLVYEGMGQSQISHTLHVSAAAISKMVDVLVKKEFIEREIDSDRRFHKLTLTPKGLKTRKLVYGEVQKILEKNLKKLTEKEVLALINGLDVLDKLMGHINEN